MLQRIPPAMPPLHALVLAVLCAAGAASGFEVRSPAALRAALGGGTGVPGTLLLRQANPLYTVGPGAVPPVRARAATVRAVLAGGGAAGPGVDDCAGIAATADAAGKMIVALGAGFVGYDPRCTLGDKEAAAVAAGAAALVVVDMRDRVFEPPLVIPGTDIGKGAIPVWVLGRDAGMAIVSALASGAPVELDLYQNPLSVGALASFVDFYRSTNGTLWSVPDPMLTALLSPLASDAGLQAATADGQLMMVLCLFGFLLRCTPRGEIASMSFTGISIHTAIPESIASMTELEALYFELADVRAPLPAALGRLPKIREIAISSNPLLARSPMVDLSGLTTLWALRVIANGVTGPFPDVSNCLAIRVYDVSFNGLSGPPPAFGAWAAGLESLSIASNFAFGALDPTGALAAAGQLKEFRADNNMLSGPVPAALASLPRLTLLRLQGNQFTGAFPAALAASTTSLLKEIRLAGSQLESPLPPFTGLPALVTLDLSGCGISGQVPALLPPSLEVLDFSHNNFTALAPPRAWAGLSRLRELYLRGNRIVLDTAMIIAHVPLSASPSEGLSILDLRDNRLHASITAPVVAYDFSLIPSLREIYLGSNPGIAGQFIWLARPDVQASLRVIDVSHTPGLAGPIQENMANFPSLRVLDVRGTAIIGNVFADGVYASPRGDGERRDPALVEPSEAAELLRHARASLATATADPATRATVELLNLGALVFTVAPAEFANYTVERAAGIIAVAYDYVSLALPKSVEIDPGTRRFDPDRNMWCPLLRGRGSSGDTKISVLADDTLHNRALCTCADGFVRLPGNECHKCPDNTDCPGSENQLQMIVRTGFFPTPDLIRPTATIACSTSVLSESPCNPDGSGTFECQTGYGGRLCSVCEDGYFKRNGVCLRCSGFGVAFVAALFFIILGIGVVFALRLARATRTSESDAASHQRHVAEATAISESAAAHGGPGPIDKPMRLMTLISVCLFYFQTLSLSMDGFELPVSLAVLKQVYDLSNVNAAALGAGCVVGKLPYRDAFMLSWILPLALLLLLWLIVAIVVLAVRPGTRHSYVRVAAGMSLVLLTLVYFPMSVLSLGVHRCDSDPVTGEAFVTRDPAVPCGTVSSVEKWIPTVIFPIAGLLAIFALAAVVVARKRSNPLACRADIVPRFAGWFFLAFQDRYFYVPVLFFARRLVVALAVALLARDNALRYASVALVIVASGGVVMMMQPYRTRSANTLDAWAHLGSGAIYIMSFIAANDRFRATDPLIILVFAIHLVVLVIFGLAFAKWIRANIGAKRAESAAYQVRPVELEARSLSEKEEKVNQAW
jgi:hypothetical protein